MLKPLRTWINLIKDSSGAFHKRLDKIYGGDSNQRAEAARLCLDTLEAFAQRYGPQRNVIVVRSTGRVNLLGTHIDHRGGSVNPIAIKQLWLVAELREDDIILARNVESEDFPDEQFRIRDCLPPYKIMNWDTWCFDEFEKRKGDRSVTWSNYIRAPVLYFQHINTKDDGTFAPALKGMNLMVCGNIPRNSGLSSSSALVMAATEALIRVNNLQIEPLELVEHCGLAEWYVGTRGGCGDHAAIIFGTPKAILHLTSFPVTIRSISFPHSYGILMADSFVEAKKQAGSRNIFNGRIAAYEFGLMMVRKNFPQYADKLEYLRDINPEKLGVDESGVYHIVRSLPESVRREDILKLLPEREQEIRHIFRSHGEPEDGYKIRQICLYGISECIRAEMAPGCLRTGNMRAFGELLCISHDGDRVTKLVDGRRVLNNNSYPASRIDALISDIESGQPDCVERARLWRQGGGYDVSIPEMDTLVDIAMGTPGVVGAGLVGAGMGGSVVVIVEDKHIQQLIDYLAEQYYCPHNLPVQVEQVYPVGGLCTMDL